jgi:hypothetical protein
MIILSIDNFKKLGKENWNNATVSEAIDLHHIGYDFKWINKDILHKGTEAYVKNIGWNPDTTLVLYVDPTDPKQKSNEDAPFETMEGLSLLNGSQCVCWFIKNITDEKFASIIDQVVRIGAFT